MIFDYWRSFIDCLVLPIQCVDCCLLFDPLLTLDNFIISLLHNLDCCLSCTLARILTSQHCSFEEESKTLLLFKGGRIGQRVNSIYCCLCYHIFTKIDTIEFWPLFLSHISNTADVVFP